MFPERLIEAETLHPTETGFSTGLRLPWYRALPLSCIERIEITVDGAPVPQDAVWFSIPTSGPHRFSELATLTDVWWYVLDSAELTVEHPVAAQPGTHEVSVAMGLHIPYLPVAGKPLVNLDKCTAQLEVASR
ncbi:C-glycoside deglycosidase beta subunit domain-containing protein [Dactylosporangium sp. CA-233914]|uniref:C-glycoside deglycosidase beta subunit domain-containing protein n=1 Tax=Dactylosporangium sp. CA-233914 TaxID=3239934 RepID=UPI003D8B8567